MFSSQASPRTIQAIGDHAKQVKMVLKASVLIFAICSSIAFSIHPIPARSYKTSTADGGYTPAVSGSSGTTIFVSPALLANASLTVGMNVTVNVFINNVTKMFAWEFTLKVDTSFLKPVGADVSPYWENQQALGRGQYIIRVNATLGTALVYWVGLRQPNGFLPSLTTNVPFDLGTATFQVTGPTADTPVHLVTYDEDPHFGTILYDTNQVLIDYGPTDGSFANVRAPWDINWDLKVDVVDLASVARSYGATTGAAGWSPTADVNGDGRIDIVDLSLVASHFAQNI